ncbi:HepT-like ribonuclease domain-containing protein [Mesorhizobium sp. BAC0120]|uniref:HepT-like ribonuclease domain-containing protein n=1 Tax=Mesorhizobium sp. BAC0120 TaxID=3090670 RepID=UPI00298C12C0|nr:HepT-like ribonuclease domain-containing protein [Mesorhizobium sp. BAC0120]MDW6023907.1 HepT-like ribonuclease domain-containing protein [Mesorhizobium sp. BAC0120]
MGEAGRSAAELLAHLEFWSDRIARYLAGISRDEFASDEMRQVAISKCIEVVGEAAGNILKRDNDFAISHPELPLAEAYRMRNRLSHGYDTVDWEILWDTATNSVPAVVSQIRLIQARNGDG